MSAGNLYRTFPSKEAIVEGLCARDQQERAATFAEVGQAESVMAAFAAGLREHVVSRPREKARLIVEIWAEAARNPAIAAMSRAVDADILTQLERMIEIAKQRGEASPVGERSVGRPLHFHLRQRPPAAHGARPGFRRRGGRRTGVRAVQGLMRGQARPGRNGGFAMSRALERSRHHRRRRRGRRRLTPGFSLAPPPSKGRARLGLPVGAPDCAARAAAAEAPAAPPPPAVTVAPAERREFVDRLFVSGTLVPRDEAQVAAPLDGLSTCEIDAEDGDRVTKGQVLARLDRSQLDALLAQNDAAIQRADAAIEQAKSLIAQVAGAGRLGDQRLRPRPEARRQSHVAGSTIEQRETAMKTAPRPSSPRPTTRSRVAEADRKARDAERQELDGAHRRAPR